ncbi:MAG: M81 family metallopeptidase [Candidatus Bathyarchaeota archaeon]|nr:MAG: M81 family metallopeptidase [Candidatus Bathyarchaeota archaeon]
MKLAVIRFSHETCTFCPNITTFANWQQGGILVGNDVLNTEGKGESYITGYKETAEKEPDVQLIGIVRADNPVTIGWGSWLTGNAFDNIVDRIIIELKKVQYLDGVLLSMHGAMAVKGVPRPEAEIARRVRKIVGNIPIMVTLDLHANEDIELANAVEAVFILKTYPHLDAHEIGITATRCMIATVRGSFIPTMAVRKPKLICASIFQASKQFPMKQVYDRCRAWERKGVYCASVAPGYAYADVPDAGFSIFVVTDNNYRLAEEAADDLSTLVWSLRTELTRSLPKSEEGVANVIQMVAEGIKPIVIAYHDDRLGDGTHILMELLRQGAQNFCATVADPKVLTRLARTRCVGDRVTVTIGGWMHPISGSPVTVTGIIEYLGSTDWVETGPMGRGAERHEDLVASLKLGSNNHVILSKTLRAPMSADPLRVLGIDVDSLDIVEIKSRVHHKAFWDGWCKVDYPVDPPGTTPADLSTLHYENLPWDIYPIGEKWKKKCD